MKPTKLPLKQKEVNLLSTKKQPSKRSRQEVKKEEHKPKEELTTFSKPAVISLTKEVLNRIADQIDKGIFPTIEYFGASKKNVEYLKERGYTAIDANASAIDGSHVASAKMLSMITYGLARFKEHIDNDMSMSLRDFYYLFKVKEILDLLNIKDQHETDSIINLSERIVRQQGRSVPREEFGVVSSPKGTFYGDVSITDSSNKRVRCSEVGEWGYFVSSRPFDIVINEINIKAAVFIEKEAFARTLIELGIPETLKIGIGALFGQPGRNMRGWIRRLADERVPILSLVDLSPWSIRIFSTIRNNSIELSNIRGLATPEAKLIGLHTSDFFAPNGLLKGISHALEDLDEQDLKCAVQNRQVPAISQDEFLQKENETLIEKKKKGELESFKAFGMSLKALKKKYLDYMTTKIQEAGVKL
jgi:DNA topoisomerase VI subunit A